MIVPGTNPPMPPQFTEEDKQHALDDMAEVLKDSAIISQFTSIGVLLQQLFRTVLQYRQGELLRGWSVTNPVLVDRMISEFAAQESLKPATAEELQRLVREHLMPVLDILVQHEQQLTQEATDDTTE